MLLTGGVRYFRGLILFFIRMLWRLSRYCGLRGRSGNTTKSLEQETMNKHIIHRSWLRRSTAWWLVLMGTTAETPGWFSSRLKKGRWLAELLWHLLHLLKTVVASVFNRRENLNQSNDQLDIAGRVTLWLTSLNVTKSTHDAAWPFLDEMLRALLLSVLRLC